MASMADVLSITNESDIDDLEEGEVRIEKLKAEVRTRKGRGFKSSTGKGERGVFERLEVAASPNYNVPAARSLDGWVLIVTGVHEEAGEDDFRDRFAEFGEVKNLHLNLDRRTGFVKGYVLIEYETISAAQSAKNALDGTDVLGNIIHVDFAFMKNSIRKTSRMLT